MSTVEFDSDQEYRAMARSMQSAVAVEKHGPIVAWLIRNNIAVTSANAKMVLTLVAGFNFALTILLIFFSLRY